MPQRTEIYLDARRNVIRKKKKLIKKIINYSRLKGTGVLAAWTGRCRPPWAGNPLGKDGPWAARLGQRDNGRSGEGTRDLG